MNKKATFVAVLMALLLLVSCFGCAQKVTVEEMQKAVDDERAKGDASLAQLELDKQSALDALQAEMDALAAQKASLESEKSALEEQIVAQGADVESLRTQVADLAEQIAQVDTAAAECQKLKDYLLNAEIDEVLTDKDIATLADSELEFDGEKYDFHEEVVLSGVRVETSQVGDKDFGELPYLVFEDGAIEYKLVFDDGVEFAAIDADEPLKVSFLGEVLEIVDADAESITLTHGKDVFLEEGQSVGVELGDSFPEVKAIIISDESGEVKLAIDGVATKALSVGESDKVGDYFVRISEVMPNEAGETGLGDAVSFKIALDEIETTVESGDYYDEETEAWIWGIETAADGELVSLSVANADSYNSADEDEETPAIKLGDYFSLPREYLSLGVSELKGMESVKIEFSFDDSFGSEDDAVLVLKTTGKNLVFGEDEVSKAGFDGTQYIYKDEDGDWKTADSVDFVNDELKFRLFYHALYVPVNSDELLCEDVTTPVCEDVTTEVCEDVPTETCEDVITTPAHSEPEHWEYGHWIPQHWVPDVVTEVCETILEKVCEDVTEEVCEDITEEVCTTIAVTIEEPSGAGVYEFGELKLTVNIAASDLVSVVVGDVDVSGRKTDVLSTSGFVIRDAETAVDDDRLSVEAPSDKVEATVCFK